MTVIMAILHLMIIAYIAVFVFRKVPVLPIRKFFFPGLFLKLVAGIVYGAIYWYYYRYGDTINYFTDALLLADLATVSPINYLIGLFTNQFPLEIQDNLIFIDQPRALFLSKIASLFVFLSVGNYWICTLYFSLFSFLGLYYLSQVSATLWPSHSRKVALAFLFFPSVVFWSAGLNKESIVMGCMGYLVAIFLTLYLRKQKFNVSKGIVLLLCIYVLWTLKYYYIAILLPILISLLIMVYASYSREKKPVIFLKLGIGLFSFISLLLLLSYLHPVLSWHHFPQNIYEQHHAIVSISAKENLILFNSFEATWQSLISHIPLALFSGLFRPGVWDAHNFLQWFAALENLALLILTLLALGNIKKLFDTRYALLMWGTIVYILIMATFMAFAAPNFGTLERYKVGFLPFFVLILLLGNSLMMKNKQ